MNYKKVLIAVDSHERSIYVAKRGFEIAEQLGAEAALIFVIDHSRAIINPDTAPHPDEAMVTLLKEAQQTLEQLIKINNQSTRTVRFMPRGNPHKEIIRTAGLWDADLIVIGTYEKFGYVFHTPGNNTQQILKHSKIPVLVVPSSKK